VHVGSLHASDAEQALRNARDLYTRRNEGVSIWVVPATAITASSPDEKDAFFVPSGDKAYRHPTFYDIPDDVGHI
jgi:ring-1,2-phenylacetyl-CoA epoxidase subunit PaaB